MMSIGAFSRLSGLSIKALRRYDARGVLRPAAIDANSGYRRYRPAQLAAAHRILALQQLGASLGEVRPQRDDRAALLAIRRSLEARLAAIEAQLATVNEALERGPSPVAVKQLPAARVIACRRVLARHDDADDLLDELGGAAAVRGAIWHDCSVAGRIDAEVFVLDETRGTTRFSAVRVAACQHGRGEDASRAAYDHLRAWLRRTAHRRAGPFREIYYGADLTEVQLPIAEGGA